MINYLYVFLILFSQSVLSIGNEKTLSSFFDGKWDLNKASLESLVEGEILSEAHVKSKGSKQSFTLKSAGWHNKKCSVVLRKLSMLENYKDWISFVNTSTYNKKARLFTLTADHTLLPHPMIIHIIMDRPTKQGVYPFYFPTGMFTGLKGDFTITEKDNRCLIFSKSHWKGPKTKYPDLVIELFAETLSKKGAQLLMRKTQF